MTSHRTRARIGAAVLAVATTLGVAVGVGPAAADGTRVYPMKNCEQISPNLVDWPYNPDRVIVDQFGAKTTIWFEYRSLWYHHGYASDTKMEWRNLRTGQHGTKNAWSHVYPLEAQPQRFTFPTSKLGTGPVKLTFTTVNTNWFWSMPAFTCTATVQIL